MPRRLRHAADLPAVPSGGDWDYHIFLSHPWATGQDQMRTVKQRLLEILPGVSVFLDVDDLQRKVGKGAEQMSRSRAMLLFASNGYFGGGGALPSRPCLKELLACLRAKRKIIVMLDLAGSAGSGLATPAELLEQMKLLDEPCTDASGLRYGSTYEKFGLVDDLAALGDEWRPPIAERLHAKIFEQDFIEWNTIGHFQDVTIRLIAERLLPDKHAGKTYLDGELSALRLRPLPRPKRTFHIYCTSKTPGAAALLDEAGVHVRKHGGELMVSTRPEDLATCDHVLLYLTSQTWTRGEASAALAEELLLAEERGVHILRAHEMDPARDGCDFGLMFSATPPRLLEGGIYSELAVPFKAGVFREASLALFAMSLGAHPHVDLATKWYRVLVAPFIALPTRALASCRKTVTRLVTPRPRTPPPRRLLDAGTTREVVPPTLPAGQNHHLFLSHVWATGQAQSRVIKSRLCEMMPDVRCFLDVDDLEDIGDLEGYIARSSSILVYCSKGYFESQNCMRELIAATKQQKPIVALLEPEAVHGGLSREAIRKEIRAAEGSYEKMGFDVATTPSGQALLDQLFQAEPIEWNRIGPHQDVTLRLIAERLLPPAKRGTTQLRGEQITVDVPPPARRFHLYCSPHNPGARAFAEELGAHLGAALQLTESADELTQSERMLLHLNRATWMPDAREGLRADVERAMDAGVKLLLVHEAPGMDAPEARGALPFALVQETTPLGLVDRDLYAMIAIPLKPGEWRKTSYAMAAQELAEGIAGGARPAAPSRKEVAPANVIIEPRP